jgi:hypothetical protein
LISQPSSLSHITTETTGTHQAPISDYKADTCLNMVTAHNMINQFLTEKKLSKEELAQQIGITLKELEQLNSECEFNQAPPYASYKLIALYCKTDWAIYEITKKEFRAKQKRAIASL